MKQAERWTAHDPVLSKVRHWMENGWSHDIGEKLAQYKHREMELSVARGYLLWGSRVVIPTACRKQALKLLYEGHMGMSRMKAKASGSMWWPKLICYFLLSLLFFPFFEVPFTSSYSSYFSIHSWIREDSWVISGNHLIKMCPTTVSVFMPNLCTCLNYAHSQFMFMPR